MLRSQRTPGEQSQLDATETQCEPQLASVTAHDRVSSQRGARFWLLTALSTISLGLLLPVLAGETSVARPHTQALAPKEEKKMSFFDLSAKDIDGKDVALKTYQGKVVLVVNVASKCGFTPQYTGLQSLYESRKDKGLVILGFPSNEFGGQEPGTEAQIKEFCSLNYHVNFPMFAKVSVKSGEGQSPVYQYLTKDQPAPRWNFSKYLVGKNGQVVGSYESRVAPDNSDLLKAIDAELAK